MNVQETFIACATIVLVVFVVMFFSTVPGCASQETQTQAFKDCAAKTLHPLECKAVFRP